MAHLLAESRRSESLLRTMIDSTPDLIFVMDRQHRYQMVNQAFANRNGMTPDYYRNKTQLEIGMDSEVVLGNPAKGIAGLWAEEQEVIATGKTIRIPEQFISINGSEKVVTTVRVPLKDETGEVKGVLCFVHDITELKRTEEDLRRKDRLLMAVAMGTLELIRNDNLEAAAGEVIKLLGVRMDLDRVNIYCNKTERGNVVFIDQLAAWDRASDEVEYRCASMQQIPASTMPFVIEVLGNNEIYCGNVGELEDEGLQTLLTGRAVRSLASIPIFAGGRFWGFMTFNDCSKRRQWTEAEFSILRSFSATLGAVIERKEIESALQICMEQTSS